MTMKPFAVSVQHLAWQDDAACKGIGLELFFAEKTEEGLLRDAKRICNGDGRIDGCPVREQCLDYAMDTHEQFGVYGGLSPRQRARLRTQRHRDAGTLGTKVCQICYTRFPGSPGSRNCSPQCARESRRRTRARKTA